LFYEIVALLNRGKSELVKSADQLKTLGFAEIFSLANKTTIYKSPLKI